MDELSFIFDKLSLDDKKEIETTINKFDIINKKNNDIDELNNICNSLNNLKLENFTEEVKPIVKKTIINNIINIGIILKNKQKCTVICNNHFIPKYIF